MSTECWPSCTSAQSACSVKAIAGRPTSSARSQLRSMSPLGASQDHSVCTWRSGGRGTRQGYPESPVGTGWLEWRAYGHVPADGRCFRPGSGFARRRPLPHPPGRVPAVVAILDALAGGRGDAAGDPPPGWAGVALGVSILAIGLTPVVPEVLGGVLVLVAMVGYLAGAVLFVYSTYLSRRVAR